MRQRPRCQRPSHHRCRIGGTARRARLVFRHQSGESNLVSAAAAANAALCDERPASSVAADTARPERRGWHAIHAVRDLRHAVPLDPMPPEHHRSMAALFLDGLTAAFHTVAVGARCARRVEQAIRRLTDAVLSNRAKSAGVFDDLSS